MRSFVLAVGIIFALIPLFAQAPAALETFHVHVVHGVTGQPLPAVDVTLSAADFQRVAGPLPTDSQGNVAFRVKAAGYMLHAEIPGIGPVTYGQTSGGTIFLAQVKAGGTSNSVTFRVFPRATLSGRVHDELGDPVPRARITLVTATWDNGGVEFQARDETTTDERGFYRIFNIPPGNYSVCAHSGSPRQLPAMGTADFPQASAARFYEATCAPSSEPGLSSLLHFAPTAQMSLDLILRSAPTIDIKGRLHNATMNVNLRLDPVRPWFRSMGNMSAHVRGDDQTFVIRGITPGQYRLEGGQPSKDADGKITELVISQIIDTRNISELDISLQPAATIEMAYEETAPGLAKRIQSVNLRAVGRPFSQSLHQQDGIASFTRLAEGKYWLSHFTDGVCITGAKLGDRDVFGQLLHVTSGMRERLVLTVSSACGTIEGRVVDDAGRPVARARYAVLLSGTPQDPGFCYSRFTGDDGTFDLSGLAPGRYLMWAWRDDDSGTAPGPASLAQVEGLATVVNLPLGKINTDILILDSKSGSR